ncbi:isochorismate synthase [Edaphobacillus lindanitolerans]|uniref:isochorismate synthase n=1 Tax=Edaphobacillus lindanitolerans TaxID=550447 RepID=A0A1U7PR26_9BACI|nr:isochorismate synthase [Edaphobacillus lindanitolerans]SIT85827.1 isochorismate synthase [Edaphobacillus lindanitolerans]
MKHNPTPHTTGSAGRQVSGLHFYTETIDAGRLSPLAFFEAGENEFAGRRFYWENRDKTLKLVGIGHAMTLTSDAADGRFADVRAQWQRLCSVLVKEEGDLPPVLFGGFSFDPENHPSDEWKGFPPAYFAVPQFQLAEKGGRTFVSINLVTEGETAAEDFERLRLICESMIHEAQVMERTPAQKPEVSALDELARSDYLEAVGEVTGRIRAGEAEKVVIARSVQLAFDEAATPSSILENLSAEQQESYLFGLESGSKLFFGATPERLVEIRDGQALTACVAGSIRRGKTASEDRELGEGLLHDPKNRSEHQYVVSMIGDVFRSFCEEVRIPAGPRLLKVRDIQHLFTPVEGIPNPDKDLLDFVEALHPTPALGGTPREAALPIIRESERMDRGFYGAPVGWMDSEGNGEFAVAIRSALLEGSGARLYAGGGIVADSVPEEEYEETWVKFRPVLRALGGKLNG